jgi:dihydrofolate reductase
MVDSNPMDTENPRISLIAALDRNTRAIGKDNQLLWNIPQDLKRFKRLTHGHPVIMGRKTWESLPAAFRPLPGRTNIVVTHSGDIEGVRTAHSLEEAFILASGAEGGEEAFVIGGGELYRQAISLADRLYLTLVDGEAEGDTFFPEYEDFIPVMEEVRHEGIPSYTFVTLERAG